MMADFEVTKIVMEPTGGAVAENVVGDDRGLTHFTFGSNSHQQPPHKHADMVPYMY